MQRLGPDQRNKGESDTVISDAVKKERMPVIAAPKRSLTWYFLWTLVLVLLASSWQGADMRPMDLLRDSGNMTTYTDEFFPPISSQWRMNVVEMIVTLQIALKGTALAVLTAVPMALMASANLVPWWIYQPTRRFMDAIRAINEMVFAMLFVVAVGLGQFAGVLTFWIRTTVDWLNFFQRPLGH